MLHPAIIGVDKDYRVLESRHGQCHHFWAEQLRSLETVDEVWEQVAGTRFDASFPGVILRLSINPLGQSGTVRYRITIHDDQGDDRGCHIKVGWALEGASSGCELVSDCDFVQLGHIQLHKDDSQDAYVCMYVCTYLLRSGTASGDPIISFDFIASSLWVPPVATQFSVLS